MKAEDKAEFLRCINALGAVFGREIDECLLDAYWLALGKLSSEQLRLAVSRALQDCKFMPMPCELLQRADGASPAQRSLVAWEFAVKAIGSHGSYRSVNFSDRLINATIRNMGGWERICGLQGDELHVWARKQFAGIYEALAAAGTSAESCEPLVGRHDRQNGCGDWGGRRKLEPPAEILVPRLGSGYHSATAGLLEPGQAKGGDAK